MPHCQGRPGSILLMHRNLLGQDPLPGLWRRLEMPAHPCQWKWCPKGTCTCRLKAVNSYSRYPAHLHTSFSERGCRNYGAWSQVVLCQCVHDDPGSTGSWWVNTRAIPPLPWYPTLLLLLPCISEESFKSQKSSLPEATWTVFNPPAFSWALARVTRGILPSQQHWGHPSLLRQSKCWCLQWMFFILIYWLFSHDCVHPSAMDFRLWTWGGERDCVPSHLASSLFAWI